MVYGLLWLQHGPFPRGHEAQHKRQDALPRGSASAAGVLPATPPAQIRRDEQHQPAQREPARRDAIEASGLGNGAQALPPRG
jgi:hypothetical protein